MDMLGNGQGPYRFKFCKNAIEIYQLADYQTGGVASAWQFEGGLGKLWSSALSDTSYIQPNSHG